MDHNPSLSIGIGRTGQPLLCCHAGCTYEAIRDALGIPVNGKRVVAAEYDYVDESGVLLYQKIRYIPKEFQQRRPAGDGGWSWKLGDCRRVLYRLPEVRKSITDGAMLWVCEGEKDADRLHHLGLVAITNSEGAAKPTQRQKGRAEYTDQLRGAKRVILLPD